MFSPFVETQIQFYLQATLTGNKKFPTGEPTACSQHSIVVLIRKWANLVSVQRA
jgi:hypothetical protein